MTVIVALCVSVLLVGADQLIKFRVLEQLKPIGNVELVPGFFSLTYVENRGAAFGIMQDKTTLLALVTVIVLGVIVYAMVAGMLKSKYMIWSTSLVVAGGVGNLIDRLFRGYVVDYLDFGAWFGFPVFNFADCCVVVGTILILIGIMRGDHADKSKEHPVNTEEA